MLLKLGVDISRLCDECRRSLNTVDALWKERGGEAVITSTYEGTHSAGSLHYVNRAYDLRLAPGDWIQELRRRLPTGFDVLQEATHIHIEWDPKQK